MASPELEAAIDRAIDAGADIKDINNILGRHGLESVQQVETESPNTGGLVDTADRAGVDQDFIRDSLGDNTPEFEDVLGALDPGGVGEVADQLFGAKKRTTITGEPEPVPGGEKPLGFMDALQSNQGALDAYNALSGTEIVDDSAFSKFTKGFARAGTATYHASVLAQTSAEVPGWLAGAPGIVGQSAKLLQKFGGHEIRWKDEETGELRLQFLSPDDMYGEGFSKASPDDQRKMIMDRKKEIVYNYYSNVPDEGAAAILGVGVGFAADVTSFAPFGSSYVGAAAVGGALAGTDTLLYQMAEKGEIEPEDIALATGVGAVAAPLILFGGRKFMGWLRGKKSDETPVTEAEIKKQLELAGVDAKDSPDPKAIADNLNDVLGLNSKKAIETPIGRFDQAFKGATEIDLEESVFGKRMQGIDAGVAKMSDEEVLKALQQEFAWMNRINGGKTVSEAQIAKDITTAKVKLEKENLQLRHKKPAPVNPVMKEAMMNAMKKQGAQTDEFVALANKSEGGFSNIDLLTHVATSSIGALTGYAYGGPEGAMLGFVAGMSIPYASRLGKKMYNEVGTMRDPKLPPTPQEVEKTTQKYMSGFITTKPENAFRSWGDNGKAFAETFKRANEDLNRSVERNLTDLAKTFYKEGIKEKIFIFNKDMPSYKQIPGLLNKTLDKKAAHPAAIKGAAAFRRVFNQSVKDAVKAGVLSAKEGSKLIQDTLKKGYFPRIYNELYLNSRAGFARWKEVMEQHAWNKDSIIDAWENVSGNRSLKDAIANGFAKTKDGKTYRMSRKGAEDLYNKRIEKAASSRSNHLQKKRIINLPDEVLKEFLIQDPMTVMGEYLRDTYRSIHLARYFGAKDQTAHKFFDEAAKISPQHKREMQEVYYTFAGDPVASNTIRQFTEMPLWMKDAYGRMAAFETLKLVFAPVVNSVQATVNGTVLLQRMTGSSTKTLSVYSKALQNSFTTEGREFAKRVGATAESSIMQIMGDMNSGHQRIIHGEAKGIWAPLNILNQPSNFLRANGFVTVENVQRVLGANMGRSLVEDIAEQNTKILKKMDAGQRIGGGDKKRLDRNKRTLEELGINPEKHPSDITIEEIERAAQRFSNEINFINTPDQMPIALQSPLIKPFMQFKSFVLKHGAFIHQNVIRPLREDHDPRPLFMYLGVGTPIGMTVDEARKLILGDDKDYHILERMLRGQMSVGALGIMTDVAGQMAYDEGGLAKWMAGPAASDISGLGHAALQTAGRVIKDKDKPTDPLKKWAIDLVPFPQRTAIKEELKDKGKKNYYHDLYDGKYKKSYDY